MKKLLFKGIVLSIGLVNILHGSAVEANLPMDNLETQQNQQSINSLEEALKDESSGSFTSRFKIGYYGGIGYQASYKSEQETEISGLLLEGGVYTLFNPIKNFFDIEVGLNAKYNTGSNDDDTKYYSGLQQATIYAGPVFRFDEGTKAISVGVFKALYMKSVRTDEMKEKGIKENDIENGIGVYVEYQYMDLIGKNIGFSRLEVEQFDIISDSGKTEETVAGIIFGMKF